MSNVIVFTSDRRRATSVEDGRSAAILFFTGVRYERQVDVVDLTPAEAPEHTGNDTPDTCVQPSGRLKA